MTKSHNASLTQPASTPKRMDTWPPTSAKEKRLHLNTHKHVAGTISMAHAGKDTGGSQFFICHAPQPHLDGVHTVFGQVTSGMDVVNAIQKNDLMRLVTKGLNRNERLIIILYYYEELTMKEIGAIKSGPWPHSEEQTMRS